jgi:glycosyltransferase involved in cell wall biosynthesis
MNKPLVSIIIPSYNRQDLIVETLDSVLAQTYQNWECLIIDDGSTDQSVQVIEEYAQKDSRIKLLQRNREPKGAPTCRNIGLEQANGNYVVYLDSDDIMAPFCLAQRVALYKENLNCDFIVFKSLLFDNQPEDAQFVWNIDTEEDDLLRFLRMDALWQTSGPIYKREFLIKIGGFREDLAFWQDFDLHLRCLLSGAVYTKHFEAKPDIYIREGRKDTISRSTSFTGNIPILQKRIDFYKELHVAIHQKNYKLKNEYLFALNSMSYFFCAQYFIRHGQWKTFLKQWQDTAAISLHPSISMTNSKWFVFLIKLTAKFKFLEHYKVRYYKKNKNSLPDYYIMNQNSLNKTKNE